MRERGRKKENEWIHRCTLEPFWTLSVRLNSLTSFRVYDPHGWKKLGLFSIYVSVRCLLLYSGRRREDLFWLICRRTTIHRHPSVIYCGRRRSWCLAVCASYLICYWLSILTNMGGGITGVCATVLFYLWDYALMFGRFSDMLIEGTHSAAYGLSVHYFTFLYVSAFKLVSFSIHYGFIWNSYFTLLNLLFPSQLYILISLLPLLLVYRS